MRTKKEIEDDIVEIAAYMDRVLTEKGPVKIAAELDLEDESTFSGCAESLRKFNLRFSQLVEKLQALNAEYAEVQEEPQ